MENKDKVIEEKLNIIALGNSTVGKTSYILKYTDNCFQQVYLATVGIDFKVKNIILPNNKKIKLHFYDTTGEERFKSISVNTVKNADGILLMYDITNKVSFEAITGWMSSIEDIKGGNFPIILIGNKCDLENDKEQGRKVEKWKGEQLAKDYNISFYETSNKNGINIEEPMLDLINRIIKYKDSIKDKRVEGEKLLNNNHRRRNEDSSSCSC